MAHLDSIRTNRSARRNAETPVVRFRTPPRKKSAGRPTLPADGRSRVMWIAVAVVMAVIVTAWLSLLQGGVLTPKGNGSGNPFHAIVDSLQRAVANGAFRQQTQANQDAAAQRHLDALRSQVFPQFQQK